MRRALTRRTGRVPSHPSPALVLANVAHPTMQQHCGPMNVPSSAGFVSSSQTASTESSRPMLSRDDAKKLDRMSRRVVEAASKAPHDPMWSHTADRGKRLGQSLAAAASRGDTSVGKAYKGKFAPKPVSASSSREDGDLIPEFIVGEQSLIGDIRAGHLVVVQRAGAATSGVVLGFQQYERNLSLVYLESTGRLGINRLTDVAFAYPAFVPASLTAQAGLADFPEKESEVSARVAILKKLRKLLGGAERAKIDIARRGDFIYDAFAFRSTPSTTDSELAPKARFSKQPPPVNPDDDHKWGRVTLDEALRFVFGKIQLRIHHAIAMKLYLQSNPEYFVLDGAVPNLLSSKAYYLRPRAQIKNLRLVKGWVLQGDQRVDAFVQKANTILEISRSISASNAVSEQPPSLVPLDPSILPAVEFSPDDLEIIRFLQASMLRQRYVQEDPYAGIVPRILKRMTGYDGQSVGADESAEDSSLSKSPHSANLSDSTRVSSSGAASAIKYLLHDASSPGEVFRFLKEIGLYVPWDTLIAYGADGTEVNRRGLEFGSAENGGMTKTEVENEKRAQVLLAESAPVVTGRARDVFELDDGLDAVRYDFGDLPVYVIDEANAHELDDGISIEPIPGSAPSLSPELVTDSRWKGEVWVHVHVADPTALVHPQDSLSRAAERLGQTTYFAERTWPMLPTSLTLGRFSLGSAEAAAANSQDSGGSKMGQPVMTFSFRLNSEMPGVILESKIRVGIVRNIKVISYDSVDAALGRPLYGLEEPLSSSGSLTRLITPLEPESVKDLGIIDQIGRQLMQHRFRDPNVISWGLPGPDISVIDSHLLPTSHPTSIVPKLYEGHPSARFLVRTPNHEAMARRTVGEFMIAAGTVAAAFAKSHIREPSPWDALPTKTKQEPDSGTPIIYRVSPRSTASEEDLAAFVAARHPTSLEIDYTIPFTRAVIFGSSSYTTIPGVHAGMGSFSYARVTSPLRRFTDLVNHWQIKAELREPLPGGGTKGPKSGGTWHPKFSKEMLQLLVGEHTHLERMAKRSSKANYTAWALMTMMRILRSPLQTPEILYAREVLSNLDAVVMNDPRTDQGTRIMQHDVFIPKLGLTAELIGQMGGTPLPTGEHVRVAIMDAKMDLMPRLFVVPAQ